MTAYRRRIQLNFIKFTVLHSANETAYSIKHEQLTLNQKRTAK